MVRGAETEILILWGGIMAEARLLFPGHRLTRVALGSFPPKSDDVRIRDILRRLGYTLRSKAGRSYALRLQNKAWDIVTEARTWAAIEIIANYLLRRGCMLGRSAEYLFEKSGAPTFFRKRTFKQVEDLWETYTSRKREIKSLGKK